MTGLGGAVVILDVARSAVGRCLGKVAADVAQIARNVDVCPCKREYRFVVIKNRR